MGIPVQFLNPEQRFWYANLVAAAVLADDQIYLSEVEFLKQVIAMLDTQERRQQLMEVIDRKKKPEITKPEGVPKEVLTAIYVELILIMISDFDFADEEKQFLQEIGELFNFSDSFYRELMRWCKDGLEWKKEQKALVSKDLQIENMQVPVGKLNDEQKTWYSQVLVSTIMLDGVIDRMEKSFLKLALTFAKDAKVKKQLMAYISNKMPPPVPKPPAFTKDIYIMIMIEVILIISADESLSYREHDHLKKIADYGQISEKEYNRLLQWCKHGIKWKQDKNQLISKCSFKEKTQLREVEGGLEPHPDNSSVLVRHFQCFICGSEAPVTAFQLKPKSQKPKQNIFGIQVFDESFQNFDYVNFNLIKVIVCPTCLFASPNKEYFKKKASEDPPNEMHVPRFGAEWLKTVEERKKSFKGSNEELEGVKRGIPTVMDIYRMAIDALKIMVENDKDDKLKWQLIQLRLTFAEVAMSASHDEEAESQLAEVKKLADGLFKKSENNTISFKSARVLLLIALYEEDIQQANQYMDFLNKTIKEKKAYLKKMELSVLMKIQGESKEAYTNRADYSKKALFGFQKQGI